MNLSIKRFFILSVVNILFFSCSEEDDKLDVSVISNANVLVVNEGSTNTASISILIQTNGIVDSVSNEVYQTVNDVTPLGSFLQSVYETDDYFFILVGGSGKVIVINKSDYTQVKEIAIENPRYMIQISSSKAYISDWESDGYGDKLQILDLSTLTITGSISMGAAGPEELLLKDGYVYVANSGGYGQSDTVTIIDASTNAVHKQIRAWDYPQALELDKNGDIWVNCRGSYNSDYSVNTAIIKIDPVTKSVEDTINTGVSSSYGIRLSKNSDGDKLYYVKNDGVYEFPISSYSAYSSPLISGSFYSVALDPNNDNIFTGANNFTSLTNSVKIYSNSGNKLSEVSGGIAPNDFLFF